MDLKPTPCQKNYATEVRELLLRQADVTYQLAEGLAHNTTPNGSKTSLVVDSKHFCGHGHTASKGPFSQAPYEKYHPEYSSFAEDLFVYGSFIRSFHT